MTKIDFLQQLNDAIQIVNDTERQETVSYYSEIIDDKMESGLSEEAAVAEMEDISVIAARLTADAAESNSLKPTECPKPKRSKGQIALLIVGSPLWIPLCLAALVVIAAFYISFWAIIISFWAISVSCFASGAFALLAPLTLLANSNVYSVIFVIGCALAAAGVGILLFFPIKELTKLYLKGTNRMWQGIWRVITGKRGKQA